MFKKCRNGLISELGIKYHEQFQKADPGSNINPGGTNFCLKYEKEKNNQVSAQVSLIQPHFQLLAVQWYYAHLCTFFMLAVDLFSFLFC